MLDVTHLMRHIREGDAVADDSAVALALLIEGGPRNDALLAELFSNMAPPNSEADRAAATAEAVRELRHYISETPQPLATAVWALGKTQDPRLAPIFASVLTRALDRDAEPLAHQALAALTALPSEAVPVETVRLAAAKGHDDVRDLAQDWLRVSAA